MNILQVKGIHKIYGEKESQVHALRDVSFSVKQGEFIAIVGTSGSGKSTLLNLIGGLDTPTKGQIIIRGHDIAALKPKELTIFRRRNIGFVFQNYSLMPVLNVYDNVALPVTFDRGKHVDHEYIRELLKELGIWEKRKRYPNELSGGQQQRVALARALANKPAVILADEPTGNLDSRTTVEVMGLLKESSRRYHQTILMVTHNEALAQACDRIIRIEDGQIWERPLGTVVCKDGEAQPAAGAGSSGTSGVSATASAASGLGTSAGIAKPMAGVMEAGRDGERG